jgi:23S rRNA (guanine745-N1)-methyltransferase
VPRLFSATQRCLRVADLFAWAQLRRGAPRLRDPPAADAAAAVGDDGAMVAARAGVQAAGHFEPLTAALTAEAYRVDGGDSSVVLDVRAGTGHHLSAMLGVLAQARGIALDASRDASRRAARAHRRVAAVRSDVWQQIPLGGATVDLALSVFAPRNGTELARVLRPGGALIVVTPDPGHLRELAMLHTLRIDPHKTERLRRQLIPLLLASEARRISWTLQLTRGEAEAMLRMGPAAQHLRPDLERRLAGLPARVLVTAAVQLWTLRRPTTRMRGRNRTAG